MKLKKKIIAGIIGLLAFTGIAGATLLSGSTSGGLVFDGPLTSEWLQSSTVASDRSADHNHTTISGGVTFGTDGATFNGTTGYLRGAVSNFRGGDSEGTIEAWISSDTSGASDYFSTADEATTGTFIIAQKTASGKILFSQKDDGGTADTIEGNTAMDLNTFYHVAITSNGTAWKLYLNGIEDTPYTISSGTNSGDWFADTTTQERDNIVIGALKRTTTAGFFDGEVRGVKVYDRELSAEEVQANFNKGPAGGGLKTGSLTEGLVYDSPLKFEWLQDSVTASDRAAAHNHGDVTGATVGADSTNFAGTDYVLIPGLVETLGSNTVGTVCTMSNVDADNALQNTVFALGRDTSSADTRFMIDYRMNDLDAMDVLFRADSVTQWRWSGASNETDALVGEDLRFCIVQDGVSPKIYFNGVENTGGSFTTSTDKTQWFDDLFTATTPIEIAAIGALPNEGGYLIYFNGELGDYKIWDRPLSAEEILLDYETNDRSLSTGSLFDQLVNWWPSTSTWLQNSTTISDKSAAHNHMTFVSAPIVGSISVDYDGVDDYSKLSIADYRSGDSEGGVMAWINLDNVTSSNDIFATSDEASDIRFLRFGVSSTDKIFVQQNNNTAVSTVFGDTSLVINTWYHATLTSSGTAWKLYLNTVEDTPYSVIDANNGDWFSDIDSRNNATIGGFERTVPAVLFDGEIADVRVFSEEPTQEEIQLHFDQTCQIYSAC